MTSILFRCILASCCILYFTSGAQQRIYHFTSLNTNNGLISNTINGIAKDALGFIWIATEDGVCRYDTKNLKTYQYKKDDKNTLPSNMVHSILVDSKNRLWVGTQKGLSLYNMEKDRFDVHYFSNSSVRVIYEDQQHRLLVGSNKGLFVFNEKGQKFEQPIFESSRKSAISTLLDDGKGNLWVGTTDDGVYVVNRRKIIHVHTKSRPSIGNNAISALNKDDAGNIWVATYGDGVSRMTISSDGNIQILPDKPMLENSMVTALLNDKHGCMWIGTDGGGLVIYDLLKKTSTEIKHTPSTSGLSNNVIRSLFRDRDNCIWIGTYSGGLNFFNIQMESYLNFKIETKSKNPSITALTEDKSGNIWFGTNGGDFGFYKNKENILTQVGSIVMRSSDEFSAITALTLDANEENVWISTFAGGLFRFNLKTKTPYRYSAGFKSGIAHNIVWILLADSKGRIWVGTEDGLNLYVPERDKFIVYNTSNSAISHNAVRSLLEDRRGNIWIGTQEGLNKVDAATMTFKKYTTKNGLTNDWILSIAEDKKGTIWLGTLEGGLNSLNPETEKIDAITSEHGIPGNSIWAIRFDRNNFLWVSTHKGLARIRTEVKHVEAFDGLYGIKFNINAAVFYRSKQGEFYLGTNDGFSYYQPEKIVPNKNIPKLVITGLKLFNEEIKLGDKHGILTENITVTKDITLPYSKSSVIGFDFFALNFIQPEKNRYAYRMEGFDEDWNYVQQNNHATYTNLNPGSYVFNVKASNNSGIWNDTGTSINLTILPPYWQTWWFRTLMILVLASILFVIGKAVQKRIREKLTISKLISDLEIKAVIAQMNPHFMFNCLNAIQELIITKNEKEARHYLQKFSRLLREVLECTESHFITLQKEITLLTLYVEMEALRFNNQFKYEFYIDPELEPEEVKMPSLMLQPFVENAIWHGLMHKDGTRILTIRFERKKNENGFQCTIRDNGIGREEASRIKQRGKNETHKSLGVKLITERISLLRKQYKDVSLNTVDEIDRDGNSTGTSVVLCLPFFKN